LHPAYSSLLSLLPTSPFPTLFPYTTLFRSLFRATGGTIVHGALSDFSAAVNDVSQFYFQVDWASRVPSSGFVISRAALSDLQGHVLLAIPDVAGSSSAPLPSIELYRTMRAQAREAG